MMHTLASALLVMTGGVCALAGYVFGAWRQRRALESELANDELDSRERFLDFLENLLNEHNDSSDERPN